MSNQILFADAESDGTQNQMFLNLDNVCMIVTWHDGAQWIAQIAFSSGKAQEIHGLGAENLHNLLKQRNSGQLVG